MASKKTTKTDETTLLLQQAGYVANTWEIVLKMPRKAFKDGYKIVQMQDLIDYVRAGAIGQQLAELEEKGQADMITASATYRDESICLTVVMMLLDKELQFKLMLGGNLL